MDLIYGLMLVQEILLHKNHKSINIFYTLFISQILNLLNNLKLYDIIKVSYYGELYFKGWEVNDINDP